MATIGVGNHIEQKMNEAGQYDRHGLYDEAKQIYEDLLEDQSIDADTSASIKDKLQKIEEKIAENEKIDQQILSSTDVAHIRSSWGSKENVKDIMQTGHDFAELGLKDEAINEFVKLVSKRHPMPEIAKLIVECFSENKSLNVLTTAMNTARIPEKIQLDLLFACGTDLLKRQNQELAKLTFDYIQKKNSKYPGLSAELAKFTTSKRYTSRYAFLLESKLVTPEQLQQALGSAKKSGKSVDLVLQEEFKIPKTKVAESLKLFYNVPFKAFDPNIPIPYELIQPLKKSFLLENKWVPLSWDLSGVDILIDDPKNLIKTDQAQTLLKGSNLRLHVGFSEDIRSFINLFYSERKRDDDDGEGEDQDAFGFMPEISFEEESYGESGEEGEEGEETSGQIVRMVDQILISAYRKGASDIHIEPSPISQKTRIRYRIDGVCQEILQLPNTAARPLLSRIKIMARLDIAERRMPQDGKIKFKRKGVPPFELRVATLPTAGGLEDAVMRILAESGAMPLDKMSMSARNLAELEKVIHQPYGLVLVVGPTGSGKTTTLHAALGSINKPGIKIWTAEDPVEISQEGLRQVECQPKIGLNFARVMRAFLRADPDVIMIGEMRDFETASIGIEASLTGHLVFSTLHTNSAPETVTRLLDMGLNPLNFSDSFLGVMAQRLVRKLCPHCKEAYHPTEAEYEEIKNMYGNGFESLGFPYTPDLRLYQTVGCEECSDSGYKGRMGIHEFLIGTPTIKGMIKRAAPTEELFIQGAKDGMLTLMQDGLAKAFQGHTDIKEIRRVCAMG
ncbi:type II/IV secretion system protein [Desulfococcaceae bacterium OttesenSCG-928-F15]|nr:type II/IV secretion system protein [Desulfococcaceae bacterium OttesenSCG-928-F15]